MGFELFPVLSANHLSIVRVTEGNRSYEEVDWEPVPEKEGEYAMGMLASSTLFIGQFT